jgi:hypothetical protein
MAQMLPRQQKLEFLLPLPGIETVPSFPAPPPNIPEGHSPLRDPCSTLDPESATVFPRCRGSRRGLFLLPRQYTGSEPCFTPQYTLGT